MIYIVLLVSFCSRYQQLATDFGSVNVVYTKFVFTISENEPRVFLREEETRGV